MKLFFYFLNIDALGSKTFMEELYERRIINPDIDNLKSGWFKDESGKYIFGKKPRTKSADAQYNYEQMVLGKLADKAYYCHYDEVGWRVHSLLTVLPRNYKKFVTFRKKPLYSIDLKCSQIFLTLALMNPDFWNPSSSTVNIGTLKMDHLFSSNVMKNKILPALANLSDDYDIFKKECCKGTIYEYMQETYKNQLNLSLSRNDVKALFYNTVFTSNNYSGQKDAEPKRLFKKLFPTVSNLFIAIKTQRKKEKVFLNKFDKFPVEKFSTLLPIMLQRLESYIFIQNIATKILSEHPDIPIFTIHDSICTTEENVEVLERIIKSEIERIVGLTPSLNITSWCDEE